MRRRGRARATPGRPARAAASRASPPRRPPGRPAQPRPAATRVGGRLEPFPGRYAPAALPVLRAALEREAPVREALAALAPAELGEAELRAFGDPARMVASLNTRAELAAAEASIRRRT